MSPYLFQKAQKARQHTFAPDQGRYVLRDGEYSVRILSLSMKGGLVVVATLFASASFACTCIFSGAFEVFAEQHPVIVRGKVLQHGERIPNNSGYFKTMTIVVSDTLKGSFPYSTFEFYGDTGMSCLRYITLDDYPVGSEHLFILASDESLQPLMVCGESSLLINGDTVQGRVRDGGGYGTYELNLGELMERVR
ncbi:hypothetical protein LCGC14_0024060 [marine sediment metagenome]|uniref:Uncharacterized protein n=2 Tax=root TaxID=1 RepID=A0A0F9WEQ1_9ZZZZ